MTGFLGLFLTVLLALALMALAAAALALGLGSFRRAWRVRCPGTGGVATVELRRFGAADAIVGCGLWPGRAGCGRECRAGLPAA